MNKKELGKYGEDRAVEYLMHKGYLLLERNFKGKYGEIDIIAQIGNCVVFVEVKTRTNLCFGTPAEGLVSKQMRRIRLTTEEYIHRNWALMEINRRIDVIEVYCLGERVEVRHIEAAFGEE